MSFTESIATCFRNYAVFRGRASRPEFWWFVLFFILVLMGTMAVIAALAPDTKRSDDISPAFYLFLVAYLAMLLPYLAAMVRRLHDTDHSGFFFFIYFIPLAGGIILLVTLATEGTRGPNQYGYPPAEVLSRRIE